jgi:hypothetical protein
MDLLGEAGEAVLFNGEELTKEWAPAFARQLEVSGEELEEMFDQLRIFFALVIVAMKSHKWFPNQSRVPTEPPPLLKRLWAAMYADGRKYFQFIDAVSLDRRLEFQKEYQTERRITVENARILRAELAKKANLPINEKYWELSKPELKQKYLGTKVISDVQNQNTSAVYFAGGMVVSFLTFNDTARLVKMMDEESAYRFRNDVAELFKSGKLDNLFPYEQGLRNRLKMEGDVEKKECRYDHIELCSDCDHHGWVYFTNKPGAIAFSLNKGIDVICGIMDSDSVERFQNDIEMFKVEGKLRSPQPA